MALANAGGIVSTSRKTSFFIRVRLARKLSFISPLNPKAEWLAVPANVWRYTLGGYQVLKKWLSYREHNLLGRPLHEDEARYFAQVVRRATAILLLGPALDQSYAAILPTATGLPQQ